MAAMLKADHKKLERTQELVAIGAASRQELEEITAVHESHATEVEAARQRLLLLGLTPEQVQALTSPSQVVSDVVVPAPIDGVITGRSANLGQVVAMGQELFVVTDLSEVWVVGDLYEQDFQSRRASAPRPRSRRPAYPGMTLAGPRDLHRPAGGSPGADGQGPRRGAQRGWTAAARDVRDDGVHGTAAGNARSSCPRAAVQAIGERHVVYVPVKDEEGKFIQRRDPPGRPGGRMAYAVLAGLRPGETVVTEGSFFLRAESLRTRRPDSGIVLSQRETARYAFDTCLDAR